jgi:hypothetical protein
MMETLLSRSLWVCRKNRKFYTCECELLTPKLKYKINEMKDIKLVYCYCITKGNYAMILKLMAGLFFHAIFPDVS